MPKGTAGFELLSVDSVEIDLGNPRISNFLSYYKGKPKPEDIHLALQGIGGDTFLALKESIRINKRIIHPIIVNRIGPKKLTVIEGNTRVMLYREFRDGKVPGDWAKIPSMVYDDLEPAQIDAIRLQSHLVGPRDWDPYSKARYLHFLSTQHHLSFDQLVDFCGGDKRRVQTFIAAFQDMEEYYRKEVEKRGEDFNPQKYSAFDLLQNSRILQGLIQAGYRKTDFAGWVIDDKFDRLEHIRKLPAILHNQRAKDVFLKRGSEEAIKLLDVGTDPKLDEASIFQLAAALERKARSLQFEELQRLREDVGSEQNEALLAARDRLKDLCKDIGTED